MKVLLSVTIDDSLQFLTGFPELLVARGWEVHIVSTPGPRQERLKAAEGVTVHSVSMERGISPIRDLRALFLWFGVMRSIRPDVVSVGTPKAALLGLITGYLFRVPVRQYLLRGLRLETETGLRRRILLAMERLCVTLSTDRVAVGSSLRDRAVELGVAPAERIAVIGAGSSNGVDLDQFDRSRFTEPELDDLAKQLGLDRTAPIIGHAGRITRDKGIDLIIDALLGMRVDGIDAQLLMIGEVDDQSGHAIVERARRRGVRFVMPGHVLDPAPYYCLMTVLCTPSFREGFANVAVEAGACGVAVVGTAATGLVDAVIDGETGLLSPVGDSGAFESNLRRMLSEPGLAVALGERGRDRVRHLFPRPLVQGRYADRLDSLIERRTWTAQ